VINRQTDSRQLKAKDQFAIGNKAQSVFWGEEIGTPHLVLIRMIIVCSDTL
jgi:hypothetical protein